MLRKFNFKITPSLSIIGISQQQREQVRTFVWSGSSSSSSSTKSSTPSSSAPPKRPQNTQQQQRYNKTSSSTSNFDRSPPLSSPTSSPQSSSSSSSSSAPPPPPPPLHSVGVDPSQLGQPGSIRLEVQVTIMQGKMKAFEKKLDDNLLKLTKISIESEVLTAKQKSNTNTNNSNEAVEDEKKLKSLQESAVEVRKQISSSAAAWMSTALTMSSLLESEEGHREEMKIVLSDILEKLSRSEFRALSTPKPPKKKISDKNEKNNLSPQEAEDEDEEFFKTHEDSIRVATLVRLARVEQELGEFETALKHSQRAVDEITQQAKKILSNNVEDSNNSSSSSIYVYLLKNSTIRYEWLLLCTLHAVILAALNKTGAEQEFLKMVSIDADKLISGWKINTTVIQQQQQQQQQKEKEGAAGIIIQSIIQEVVTFAELMMRYADSLGLEEGGGGWKKPQDPIFVEKRKVCEYLVARFHPLLGKAHPIILQARACLALDCGGVAVSRDETVSIMSNLISDAQERLRENQSVADKEEQEAKKTGFNDVLGTANEDLFALRAAILMWQRKLALAFADLKQFDQSLKLLSATSAAADDILGVSHPESIIALRCWMKVAWVSGDEEKAKELHGKLAAREKPAAI